MWWVPLDSAASLVSLFSVGLAARILVPLTVEFGPRSGDYYCIVRTQKVGSLALLRTWNYQNDYINAYCHTVPCSH